MEQINKIKEVAMEAARQAGQAILEQFNNGVKKEYKKYSEIFTAADLQAEKIITRLINQEFPTHRILSEERGEMYWNNGPDWLWLIDPIDGSTNFSLKNPLFSVSIALAYQQKLVLGVVNIPFLKEFYWAQQGKGAFKDGEKIKVSSTTELAKSFLTTGYGHSVDASYQKQMLDLYHKIVPTSLYHRDFGSAAIELAFLAAGRLEATVLVGTRSFDAAAGALLVQEAGGRVTDFHNRPWSINDRYLAGSNGLIHDQLIKVINE